MRVAHDLRARPGIATFEHLALGVPHLTFRQDERNQAGPIVAESEQHPAGIVRGQEGRRGDMLAVEEGEVPGDPVFAVLVVGRFLVKILLNGLGMSLGLGKKAVVFAEVFGGELRNNVEKSNRCVTFVGDLIIQLHAVPAGDVQDQQQPVLREPGAGFAVEQGVKQFPVAQAQGAT